MNSKTQASPFYYRVRPPLSETDFTESIEVQNKPIDNSSFYFDSLRGSIAFFLSILKIENNQSLRVGLQVFTCSGMLQVIRESGDKVVLFDINREYFSSSPADIPFDQIDVLILTHLFGIPNPHYEEIAQKCRKHEIILIDDLASSVNTEVDGIPVGSLGDACAYSYGFDKPLSCYGGGELVINNEELKNKAREMYKQLPVETDRKGQNDLKRLLHYYRLTAPDVASRNTHTVNLIEPFLIANGKMTAGIWRKSYQLAYNSKAAVLTQSGKIVPRKMNSRKVSLIQFFHRKYREELEERDRIAWEVLMTLKSKYGGLHIPQTSSNSQSTLHRPPVLIEDPQIKSKLINHPNIQFGAYNWNQLVVNKHVNYPVANYVTSNLINIPHWDKGILRYV